MLLKCLAFAFGSLQLRSGFPPPASYSNGMGRHTFVFMRSLTIPSSLAFHIFMAIPFLYEIRQILDWSCTATTLTLYDWLKLEDINNSLYFAAVMQKTNSWKPIGVRQPRYLKFFQGTLFLVGMLLLLWVPLLIFSSGNPTTLVPSVIDYSMNVTLAAGEDDHKVGFQRQFNQKLMTGGNRGGWVDWFDRNSSLPIGMEGSFLKEQFQLLCSSEDSDDVWKISPPARNQTIGLLLEEDTPIVMSFAWRITRDIPGVSDHGGPVCEGSQEFTVSTRTRKKLATLIGPSSIPRRSEYIQIEKNSTKSEGGSLKSLFPAFWLLRGDGCEVRPIEKSDLQISDGLPGSRSKTNVTWANVWIACRVSMGDEDGFTPGFPWWTFKCAPVTEQGRPYQFNFMHSKLNSCPEHFSGPFVSILLGRVQGGLIGETINKFGVIGLYTVFVYGIGRFLRLR